MLYNEYASSKSNVSYSIHNHDYQAHADVMKSLLRQITYCYVCAQVSKRFFDKRDFSNLESSKIDNFFRKCGWLKITEFWPKPENSRESKILQSSSQRLVVYVTVCITESDRKVISLQLSRDSRHRSNFHVEPVLTRVDTCFFFADHLHDSP